MTIETTTTIGGLNPSFPGGTDEIKEGDDHIRLMKSVLQADALSLAKLTQQNVLGPVFFGNSVSVTGDFTVAGNIGNAQFAGVTTLWNPAPELRFHEADQTDPNGRYRLAGNNGGFGLLKALSAGWATYEEIWAYTTIGGFRVSKDAVFGAGLRVEGSTPDIRFVDWDMIDPAGRYRINVIGDAIHLQRALTANWATTTDIWNYDHTTALLTIPKKVVAQGGLEVTGTAPRIEFTENDQTKPAGQYRILASSDNFYIQRALTADFATSITVMQCGSGASVLLFPIDDIKIGAANTIATVLTMQGTGAANYFDNYSPILSFRDQPGSVTNARIDPAGTSAPSAQTIMTREKGDTRYLNATGGTVTGAITLATTQPLFYFEETDQTDPAGRYRLYGSLGNFYFQKAATASWGSNNTIWSYDNVANEFGTTPNTKLATAGGTVEIGHSTASQVIFQRSGINYIKWPNAGSLYLLTDTGVNAAVLTGTLFNTYPLTKLAIDSGTVEIGNTTSSSIEFKRSSGGINYLKPPDGTTLRVQATGGGNWASVSSASGWVAGTCDIRLKENVVDIHYGLDTILALRSVEFDRLSDGLHDLGLVSQEVQPIVPEAIEPSLDEESGETYLFLRKDNFVPILIKAVQELTARVEALEGTPA